MRKMNVKLGQKAATALNRIKLDLMQGGYIRTSHLLDIATQEIGWEMQGVPAPEWQKKRQQETLTP